jgi:hypothetical protein
MSTQTQTQPDKNPIFLKKTRDGVHYTARHNDLEVSGYTSDKVFYRETVQRILSAPREAPDSVYRIAELVVRHVSAAVAELGADYVTVGMAAEVECCARLTVHVYLTYLHDVGTWRGAVEATFEGRDGRSEGVHVVKKRIEFSGDVDIEALRREVIRVARHAYNAYSNV